MDLKNTIEQAFSGYAAMTIQQRAIVDARDFIKPSARMCFYAQKLAKLDSKHAIQASPASVGECLKNFYLHGDASCYSLLARYGKEYIIRYNLEDFHGSTGSLISSGSEAAPRYTKMRLSELGDRLFNSIEKDTIGVWFDNFSNTKKYPSVLPSLGYYNIVNGTLGIATGISTSVPEFNLVEVNNAMIKLLYNKDIDFDEIYCAPDFVGGATILNGDEVKESLKNGRGKACCIRSTIDYDEKDRCLVVTEIPYGVFTNTICSEVQELVNNGELIGVERILDLTKRTPNIKIYLSKTCNVSRIIKELYKKTSLQSYYSINMMLLDKGTTPKVFGWREALLAHIEHEREVRTKAHTFDLITIANRLNILEGFLIAIANIDEVVSIIRGSNNKAEAKKKLIERFGFNDNQTEAILKLTLSKLINLEIQSFKDEKNKLLKEKDYHEKVLADQNLLNKEIEKDMLEVAAKYGDERRTRVINLDFKNDNEDAEPIEKKELLIHYTNLGNIYTLESSTLLRTRRGGKGSKIKLAANEVVTKTICDDNFGSLLVFSNKGKMYHLATDELPLNTKVNISTLFEFEACEKPTTLTTIKLSDSIKYFIFITKNGMIKKTEATEYNIRKGKSIKAINLKDNDEIINVHFVNNETIGLLTNNGNFVRIETSEISPIGRAAMGIKAIKLNENDFVIDSKVIKSTDKYLITISEKGLIKKTNLKEFPICSRGIKGRKISEVKDSDVIVKFLTLKEDCDIIIIVQKKNIKINSKELRLLSRAAVGVKAVTTNEELKVVDLTKDLA